MIKIIKSFFVITASIAAVAGATYAAGLWDSDSVTGNVLGMYTQNPIDVVIDKDGVYGTDVATGNSLPVTIGNMYPGFLSESRYFAVVNNGSMTFNWGLSVTETASTPGAGGSSYKLSDVLKFKAWWAGLDNEYTYQENFDCKNEGIYSDTASTGAEYLPITSWPTVSTLVHGLQPGKGSCVKFQFKLDNDLGDSSIDDNNYIGANATYMITAGAVQSQ